VRASSTDQTARPLAVEIQKSLSAAAPKVAPPQPSAVAVPMHRAAPMKVA